jgi:hypothetical protein
VYGKGVDDLIDIEKNLVFMHVLTNMKLIKTHDVSYKEFYGINKGNIAKMLVKNANKFESLRVAAWVVADYGLRDFEIVNGLKSRLMSYGIEGMEIVHAMRMESEMMVGSLVSSGKSLLRTSESFVNIIKENIVSN